MDYVSPYLLGPATPSPEKNTKTRGKVRSLHSVSQFMRLKALQEKLLEVRHGRH